MLTSIFSKFDLNFHDPHEEKEYLKFKTPLLREYLNYLFCFTALLFLPLTYRYHQRNLHPQFEIGLSFLALTVIIFFNQQKLRNYLESISLVYIFLILSMFLINIKIVLHKTQPYEAFYIGYTFALVHKMLNSYIMKYKIATSFSFTFLVIKSFVIGIPDFAQGFLVLFLEIFPNILSFKIEKADRLLFDNLHKSKYELLKFKDFLTKNLPSQMAIFAKDYSCSYFVNDSFQKTFQCSTLHRAKSALDNLILQKEDIVKDSETFDEVGYILNEYENRTLTLNDFMKNFTKKRDQFQNLPEISFQVFSQNLPDILPFEQQRLPTNENLLRLKKRFSSLKPEDTQARSPLKRQSHLIKIEEVDEEDQTPKQRTRRTSVQKFYFKVRLFPLLWDNDDAIGIVIDDITHEKTITELKIIDKNKDLVIAMISHELRTPLNGMLGIIDIIKQRLKQDEISGYLDACKNNSLLLLNLVNSILDFSQIKNDKLKLVYTRVYIAGLLAEIRTLFDHFCRMKNLSLTFKIGKGVPASITTDRTRLSQVLINLVGNAFKFTFKGGICITVDLEDANPRQIRFSVQDTGIGIKEEDKGKFFRLFGRLEHEDKNINSNGVGLGLTISNTLAALLSPSAQRGIEFESFSGKGSTFSFIIQDAWQFEQKVLCKLDSVINDDYNHSMDETAGSLSVLERISPYSQQKNSFTQESLFQRKTKSKDVLNLYAIKNNIKKKWCLIVDDNPFNLIVANHIMQEKGYQVKNATNGEEALQAALDHESSREIFQVILMDCQMPVMDGFTATRKLRELMRKGRINETPIIALTANNMDEQNEKLWKEAGMSGCVAKPMKIEDLEKVLNTIYIQNKKSL